MKLDFDVIRTGLVSIPFNAHVGLQAGEISQEQAVVRLPEAEHLATHIGSQHGSALFAAAEAASGAAVYAALADHISELIPLAEGGDIRFTRRAEGPLEAHAVVRDDTDELLSRLHADGRTRLIVDVEVTDQEYQSVASALFYWYLRAAKGDESSVTYAEG